MRDWSHFRSATDRRRFLQLTAGAALGLSGGLGLGCSTSGSGPATSEGMAPITPRGGPGPIVVPKINDGVTVQLLRRLDFDPNEDAHNPVIVPDLIAIQLRTLYELGFDGMRLGVCITDRAGLLAAIPYVRAVRAIGIDAIVILAEAGGISMAHALWEPTLRERTLGLYNRLFAVPPAPAGPGMGGLGPGGVGRVAFQILNEPALFSGVPPDVYVREILTPTFNDLKQLNSEIIVVSAAEVGTTDGPPRIRVMLEAGLERTCDRIAYHVYDRAIINDLPPHVRSVVWVTETGSAGTATHLPWVMQVYPELHAHLEDLTRLFYFDLYDMDAGKFRLIDIVRDGESYRAVTESTALCEYLAGRVQEAAAGRTLRTFDELVPDIRAYLATPEDVAAIDDAVSG